MDEEMPRLAFVTHRLVRSTHRVHPCILCGREIPIKSPAVTGLERVEGERRSTVWYHCQQIPTGPDPWDLGCSLFPENNPAPEPQIDESLEEPDDQAEWYSAWPGPPIGFPPAGDDEHPF